MRIMRYIWLLGLLLAWNITRAQTPIESFSTQVEKAFLDYEKRAGMGEKLYLTTDKPYYSAGDKIYFSAFLIDPIRFKPVTESSFLYVELISADGRLIKRMKFLGERGRFANAMPLSTKLDAGRYTLRAYTRWMSNFDEKYLFHKEIEIGNYIDDAIITPVSYELLDDKTVAATVTLMDSNNKRLTHQEMEYTLNLRGKSKSYRTKSNERGEVIFKFRPSESPEDCLRLKVSANSRTLERTLQLPSFNDDFDVQFFPEGGNLIAGRPQTVAFKAIGRDGKAVEVSGMVCNSQQDTICEISSQHKGMGLMLLTAEAGGRYTATLTSERGVVRTFPLPAAQPSGCAIQVQHSGKDMLLMKVSSTPDLPITRLAAVIQSRGLVEAVIEDLSRLKRISLAQMEGGIVVISIVDKESCQIVAERLVFADKLKVAIAEIKADKSHFSPREKLSLDLSLRNSRGVATAGSLVMSVTDAEAVEIDPTDETIFSYLLLSSDLHGPIERPGDYFNHHTANRQAYLDLVMLTNGWRRYDVSKILKGDYPKPLYRAEKTQQITGRVTGVIGKPKEPSIAIFHKDLSQMLGLFQLNSSNRFRISGIDMPDTALYYIQALNRRGSSRSVEIRIDPETFPSTNIPLRRPYYKGYQPTVSEELLMGAKERYYTEGGMRVIDIEEVVVTAKREVNYSYSTMVDSFNSLTDELKLYASVYDALQRFHQLEVFGTNVWVRKDGVGQSYLTQPTGDEDEGEFVEIVGEDDRSPAVLINDVEASVHDLDLYAMEDITRLAYIEAKDAVGMLNAENGVIVMEVRDINRRVGTGNPSIAEVLVAGYCKPVEFYAPRYDTNRDHPQKDLRTTIAWEPNLRCDTDGRATVSFWTADRTNDYNVVVEGITDEGELCRTTYRLKAAK